MLCIWRRGRCAGAAWPTRRAAIHIRAVRLARQGFAPRGRRVGFQLRAHMLTRSIDNTNCKSVCNNCATLPVCSSARRQQLALHGRATCHDTSLHPCSAGRRKVLTTVRRSARQWFAMLLVPKVAANMVNAHLANAICLTTRRSAFRGNRSTKARGPRNIANAHLVSDWSTLREAKRVQHLIVCSCPPPMTRIRASAAPRKCVLPNPVHSNNARSHLTRRPPPDCRNLQTKKNTD